MPTNKGIVCDYCAAKDFEGLRYCCEICKNYDLCDACYNNGEESLQHSKSHPMKCISEPIIRQILTYKSTLSDEQYKDQLNETEYLTILLDYCSQSFIDDFAYCYQINTTHFKEAFADALNWKNGFIAKLSGSRLSGLVEEYLVESDDDQFSIAGGDTDIMFEPQDAFVSDIDTGSLSQIGFVEITQYPGFYYIEYNSKTKYHSTLKNLDIFEKRNDKQYVSSKKLTDLLHNEFLKYSERGPCLIELHGPAVSTTLKDDTSSQDFVFSLPMLKIPYHIREQWLNRSKEWPSIDVVEMVSNSVCHLVPKRWNTINEVEEDPLTWRLSLSFAEVLLTNSWTKKQRQFYLLLKSFVQELAPGMLRPIMSLLSFFIGKID
ncbi:unnamed protein product [Rotaria sp. Silwood2]|nr:unnamed protein product [Rotaria sp. Silwood2]CAF4179952.1 unnamed protein product [Rotaria sp. Silwood2]